MSFDILKSRDKFENTYLTKVSFPYVLKALDWVNGVQTCYLFKTIKYNSERDISLNILIEYGVAGTHVPAENL